MRSGSERKRERASEGFRINQVEGLCESASRSIRAWLCTGPLREEVLREKKKDVGRKKEGGKSCGGERKKENA